MSFFQLPQNDIDPTRPLAVEATRAAYTYGDFSGVPVSASISLIDIAGATPWDVSTLGVLARIRANIEIVAKKTGWQFYIPLPQLATPDFLAVLTELNLPRISEYFIPALGGIIGGGRPERLADYDKPFELMPVPHIAERYMLDSTFAYSFVAGPNPAALRQMRHVPANFPITDEHLQQLPAGTSDSLAAALAEGRIYYLDFAVLNILKDGFYPDQPKYVYQPLCAFCVPKSGGLMQPFAIQLGQDSAGREIYTPRDGWSWQLAKSMTMVANFNHHEAVTHVGHSHLVLEPVVLSTYRNLAPKHPLYGLLEHHFAGTLQINYLALNWLLKPEKPFNTLTGAQLETVYDLITTSRLEFDFRASYLPTRLAAQGLTDAAALPVYPYRDDALALWQALNEWATDFVGHYYQADTDIVQDRELQAWAKEIAAPDGGKLKNFTSPTVGIESRAELIGILTMIMFTAGPEHAAVNFPQHSDMSYLPAAPLAGCIPEIRGKRHTEADFLAFLPPLDVACSTEMIMDFLGEVHFDRLGDYGLTFAESPEITAAIGRLQAKLTRVEAAIDAANATRPYPYPHLKPSRVPQSINV